MPTLLRNRRSVVAAFIAIACTGTAWSAGPSFWLVSTQADFLKGDVEQLSIDSHGRLVLGPSSTQIYEATAPFLWTTLAAPDGAVYVGSGNEGQVFRIDPAGRGSVFFDAEELEVHAIAPAPNGGLYVGTSPDGRIYKVDSKGIGSVLFDPIEKYIWSLAVDKAGAVYAATGDKGVVYKITPDGKGAPFYDTKATHAMTLAFDQEGRVLVGTASPGRVFQLDAAGKPFVLLESAFNEIRTLRVTPQGVTYAAAVGGSGAAGDRPSGSATPDSAAISIPSPSPEITSVTIAADVVVSASAPTPTARLPAGSSAAGALYRILPDGAWDLVWESREDTPYDMGFEGDGALLVTTGNKGKIFRLAGDPLQATLVTRAAAQQVTSLLRDGAGALVYATSNPGKLFRLSSARAEKGTYESEIHDARTVASWGTIRWQGIVPANSRIEITTRAGNTRTPDETWGAWSSAYQNAEGSAVSSPQARYLQWRAVLVAGRGDSPVLTSVTTAYLQRNLRPRVMSVTIQPPGTVFQKPFPTGDPGIAGFDGNTPDRQMATQAAGAGTPSAPSLGRRAYEKGLLTFIWRAEDGNADDLEYNVEYRLEGQTEWKTLKRALTEGILVWDTSSVPNGRYVLRVLASDAPSNAPPTALTGHLESTAFDIDNAPPVVQIQDVRPEGSRTIVTFDVRDAHSVVQKVEYSVDGNRWRLVYPKDGIADSRVEQFVLTLDGDGARGLVIRATDALNNIGSASAQDRR